ncbi:DNA polymerase III subunit beta [Nonomuraea sp. NPDC049486]|uniref:DNA polymerase III subunit beta n=1 Tax=Nonomuraea sp. NPDC049486 TaxID=3155773 RepID=UPI003441025E
MTMMFTMMAGELAEAAAWTAHALPRRATLPVLAGMLVEAGDGEVAFSAFDYETSRRRTAEVAAKPGRVLLPGRLLAEVAKTLPKNEFVDVEADERQAWIRCGKAAFEIPAMPVEDYPKMPKMPAAVASIPAKQLTDAVGRVAPAAGTDDTVPMLTGVRVEASDGLLSLAATDRYRIAWHTIGWQPVVDAGDVAAVIPAKTLADIVKGFPDGDVQVGVDGSMASFSCDGYSTTVRLLDPEYPNLRAHYGKVAEAPHKATVDSGELAQVVRRVSLLAARHTAVRLAFTSGQVTVEAGSADGGLGREAMDAQLDGGDVEIAFNPRYLADALAAVGGQVELRMLGNGKPALFQAAGVDGEPGYWHVVMSVRLS